MTVAPLPSSGNSSKFRAVSKNGEFTLALSFTLKTRIWKLADANAELTAAQELAEAIVSRHNPALPFQPLYIFAEHTAAPALDQAVRQIRKTGFLPAAS